MTKLRVIGAAVVACLIFGQRASALELSQETYQNYQAYLKQIGSTKHGAFAVSPDGRSSWYMYCEETNCIPTGIGQAALQKCQSVAGKKCNLMATDRRLRIEFTVAPQ